MGRGIAVSWCGHIGRKRFPLKGSAGEPFRGRYPETDIVGP